MKTLNHPIRFVLLISVLTVAACGGGGGGGPGTPPDISEPVLKNVLFSRDAGGLQDDLFVIKEDGTDLQTIAATTDSERYCGLTPDNKIIFVRFGVSNRTIYQIGADGTGLIPVYEVDNTAGLTCEGVSPDGHVIFSQKINPSTHELFSIKPDGSGLVSIAQNASSQPVNAITRDNHVIYRTSDFQSFLSVKTDGTSQVTLLTRNTVDTDFIIFEAVTPGNHVILKKTLTSGKGELFSINADGSGGLLALGSGTGSESYTIVSPDERVIYRKNSTIYSIFADGSALVELPLGGSPSTIDIAFTSDNRMVYNAGGDVFIARTDGTGSEFKITDSAHQDSLSYITTDNGVVLSRNMGGGNTDLFIINVDGTGLLQLTDTVDSRETAKGVGRQRIIIRRTLIGDLSNADLLSVKADGTGLVVLTDTPDREQVRVIF